MVIAGNLALLAASTPAALSLRREFPSPASLLRRDANSPAALHRLPAPPRSAAARCSLAVVRAARANYCYLEDNTVRLDGVNVQRVATVAWLFMRLQKSKKVATDIKRKLFSAVFRGILILIGVLAVKWRI